MKNTSAACIVALLAILLAMPAMAQDSASNTPSSQQPNEATQQLNESIEQSNQTEDGATQSSEGQAKPEENWFGCKPDKQEQQGACDDRNDDGSEGDDSKGDGG